MCAHFCHVVSIAFSISSLSRDALLLPYLCKQTYIVGGGISLHPIILLLLLLSDSCLLITSIIDCLLRPLSIYVCLLICDKTLLYLYVILYVCVDIPSNF